MALRDVGIIIPAYNEEKTLEETLKALKELPPLMDILVVDDGSWDRTGDIAREQGVELITLDKNYGKGRALKEGIVHLQNPIIVFLDADVGETAKEITKLVEPLLEDRAEVTIGSIAYTPGKGGLGLVKGLSRHAFKSLTGIECASLLSGQRAFKSHGLDHSFFDYRRYGIEFGMTVDLVQSNLRILEVPIDIRHRVTGRDYAGFKHRGKQFWDILMVILQKKIKGFYPRRANR